MDAPDGRVTRYLHGLHDPGGEHLFGDKPGWVVISEAIGADRNDHTGGDYRFLSDPGHGVLVRLNYAHNGVDGTVPTLDRALDFAARAAAYVAASAGCMRWIIGNEPNHEAERPHGEVITPEDYATVFNLCADHIHDALPSQAVILAAVAPWTAATGDWLDYFRAICARTAGRVDGLALHTYTHGADPHLVTSEAGMDPPYQHRRFHFRAYQDFLAAVPVNLRHLPVYLTETNPGDAGWPEHSQGWVPAALAEVDQWNARLDTQKIHCVCLYRWQDHDRWAIAHKPGVQADLAAAVQLGFPSPASPAPTRPEEAAMPHQTYLPSLPAARPLPRSWDLRLTERGARILPVSPNAGPRWIVTLGRWLDEQEADATGPDHHLLLDVRDEAGARLADVPLRVRWPGGDAQIVTRPNPDLPYAADFPLTPSRNEFSVAVDDGLPSEVVSGLGMGVMTPAGFNPGAHSSTVLHFRRVLAGTETAPPGVQAALLPPDPPVHPLADPAQRAVSQPFGANPAAYARWGLAGHNGLDFAVPTGTPVRAAAAGEVAEAWDDAAGYGHYVKLRHPWGETLYAHLSAIQVQAGQTVAAGAVLGQSGSSGNSTGPHLHFGLRVVPYVRGAPFDGYTDPAPWLAQAADAAPAVTPRAALEAAAAEFGLDAALLLSLAWAESSWNPAATSPAGARGLMQIMPATWAEWSGRVGATDPADPVHSARTGASYLRYLLQYFAGDARKALWAYNWGIGNVGTGRTPPADVQAYANQVLHGRDLLHAVWAKAH